MSRSKRFVSILCCLVLIFSTLLCSCTDSRTKDTGSYTTDKKLCWIKHDTHYENNKPVNIAELYVTEFNGKKYTASTYSLNDVLENNYENWKILQNPTSKENDSLYIANYSSKQIDIVRFTLADGFSSEIYHYTLPEDTYDNRAFGEVGEMFAFTNEFIYYTTLIKSDSCYEVSICRYNIVNNTNETLTFFTVSKSYYSTPVLSCNGDLLFIVESFDTAAVISDADWKPGDTFLYMLSQGEVEYIDKARLAIWSDDGSEIIYQPLDALYMLYDIASKETSVYVNETLGRNSFCDSFDVSGNDIAYWADQQNLYVRDGLFTWAQMVPDGVKLVLMNSETGEEMVIIGCDAFKQFEFVDCSRLVWIE